MKRVTLTTLLTPDKKIVAIKNLRDATRAPGEAACVLGLKEAKDIVDALQYYGTPAEIEAYDLGPLDESFSYVVTGESIDKALVLDFVLDVLALSPRDTATQIMSLKTYRLVKDALR